jgi:branched-chain amino acid transport system permease protein
MATNLLVTTLVESLMLGMFYVLIAAGLTLVYSILDIVNFAHGEFYMFGGFVSYVFFSRYHLNFFLVLLLAFLLVGAFAMLVERVVFRRYRGQILPAFIVSLGLVWIFRESMRLTFGNWDKAMPVAFPGMVQVGGVSFPLERMVITAIGAILIAILYAVIRWSRFGRAMRAIAQDREAAVLQGVNIDSVSALAFGLGCGLAAMAGVLMGSMFYVSSTMGAAIILKSFLVIILGGLGSIAGCVVGGLVLGFVDNVGSVFMSVPVVTIATYTIIFVLLIFRPRGLLGSE